MMYFSDLLLVYKIIYFEMQKKKMLLFTFK